MLQSNNNDKHCPIPETGITTKHQSGLLFVITIPVAAAIGLALKHLAFSLSDLSFNFR